MFDWWTQLNNLIYVLMGTVVGGFVILIRKVFTNERQIELLKSEISQRNEARKEGDEKLRLELAENRAAIAGQLSEIRLDIKNLLSGNYVRGYLTRSNDDDND